MKYVYRILLSSLLVLTLSFFTNCKQEKKEKNQIKIESKSQNQSNVIEIITNVMDFQCVDTVPSGWNTFKYINKSTEPHFVLFDDYPEGKNSEDANREVVPAFDKGMLLINKGKMEEAMAAFGELPDWFGDIVFTGGSGMISPKQENTFTIKLLPGLYIIECYVKMSNGIFHTSMGMSKEIWVTEENSGNKPPEADMNLSISSTDGINYSGTINSGWQTFKVDYLDQIVHENFVGHDVNLVKLEEGVDINALEAWMNWATPTGLMTPVPEHVVFLGGTNDGPAGTSQYFKVNLTPGDYAFIAEVPNASSKGMLKTFTIK